MSDNNYALILTFDDRLETQIVDLWNTLAEQQISASMPDLKVRPHITLGTFEDKEPLSISNLIDKLAARSPFEILFSSLGIFPSEYGVLYLATKPTMPLLDFHDAFTTGLGTESHLCGALSQAENWVPHCTLALPFDAAKRGEALSKVPALSTHWQPLKGHVTGIEWISYLPVTVLQSKPLSKSN